MVYLVNLENRSCSTFREVGDNAGICGKNEGASGLFGVFAIWNGKS